MWVYILKMRSFCSNRKIITFFSRNTNIYQEIFVRMIPVHKQHFLDDNLDCFRYTISYLTHFSWQTFNLFKIKLFFRLVHIKEKMNKWAVVHKFISIKVNSSWYADRPPINKWASLTLKRKCMRFQYFCHSALDNCSIESKKNARIFFYPAKVSSPLEKKRTACLEKLRWLQQSKSWLQSPVPCHFVVASWKRVDVRRNTVPRIFSLTSWWTLPN